MEEDIENGTFHICPKKKLIFICYNSEWYEISFKKVNDLYANHDPSPSNERISPSGIENPLNYVMKYYIE